MLNKMISTSGDNASLAGGTISGDLTITGDLKVEGGGSFTYDEIIEGDVQLSSTSGHRSLVIQTTSVNHQTYLDFKADRPADGDNIGNIRFYND